MFFFPDFRKDTEASAHVVGREQGRRVVGLEHRRYVVAEEDAPGCQRKAAKHIDRHLRIPESELAHPQGVRRPGRIHLGLRDQVEGLPGFAFRSAQPKADRGWKAEPLEAAGTHD